MGLMELDKNMTGHFSPWRELVMMVMMIQTQYDLHW
jgi:hypothetical protein